MRFTVFFAAPMFSYFSEFVAEDGSTWANIGLKMGQLWVCTFPVDLCHASSSPQ